MNSGRLMLNLIYPRIFLEKTLVVYSGRDLKFQFAKWIVQEGDYQISLTYHLLLPEMGD